LAAGDPGCSDSTASNLSLTWSPDGAKLLVTDAHANTLMIWSISK
jgi:sugar lactone lactonase YvrE